VPSPRSATETQIEVRTLGRKRARGTPFPGDSMTWVAEGVVRKSSSEAAAPERRAVPRAVAYQEASMGVAAVSTTVRSPRRSRCAARWPIAEQLLADPSVGRLFPILHDAERVIADPVVRNRGTVGGSLCQADPSEDLSAAFSALRATAVIRGRGGSRTVPVREFRTGPYETAVEPGELLVEVRVPVRTGAGSAYKKVERRVGDWAVAAAGALLVLRDGVIAEAGIGLTAVGAAHFAAPQAEAVLTGETPGEELSATA
jgi:hypothetical protein